MDTKNPKTLVSLLRAQIAKQGTITRQTELQLSGFYFMMKQKTDK